ncbi:MAG TPA: hypothetical protein VK563_15795 [Puia sp.]|nr:hypothetical protein [Puia sp.]
MFADTRRITELIYRYNYDGRLNASESTELHEWIDASEHNRGLFESLTDHDRLSITAEDLVTLQRIREKVRDRLQNMDSKFAAYGFPVIDIPHVPRWRHRLAQTALLILFAASAWFWHGKGAMVENIIQNESIEDQNNICTDLEPQPQGIELISYFVQARTEAVLRQMPREYKKLVNIHLGSVGLKMISGIACTPRQRRYIRDRKIVIRKDYRGRRLHDKNYETWRVACITACRHIYAKRNSKDTDSFPFLL